MLCCRQSRTEDMRAITAYSCIPLVNTRPWRGLSNAELHTQGIASAICYLPVRIGLQQLKHCHQTWQPSKSNFGFTPTWFNCTPKNSWINVRNQRWNIQIAHKIICIIKLFEIHSTLHITAHGQWINISTQLGFVPMSFWSISPHLNHHFSVYHIDNRQQTTPITPYFIGCLLFPPDHRILTNVGCLCELNTAATLWHHNNVCSPPPDRGSRHDAASPALIPLPPGAEWALFSTIQHYV